MYTKLRSMTFLLLLFLRAYQKSLCNYCIRYMWKPCLFDRIWREEVHHKFENGQEDLFTVEGLHYQTLLNANSNYIISQLREFLFKKDDATSQTANVTMTLLQKQNDMNVSRNGSCELSYKIMCGRGSTLTIQEHLRNLKPIPLLLLVR